MCLLCVVLGTWYLKDYVHGYFVVTVPRLGRFSREDDITRCLTDNFIYIWLFADALTEISIILWSMVLLDVGVLLE